MKSKLKIFFVAIIVVCSTVSLNQATFAGPQSESQKFYSKYPLLSKSFKGFPECSIEIIENLIDDLKKFFAENSEIVSETVINKTFKKILNNLFKNIIENNSPVHFKLKFPFELFRLEFPLILTQVKYIELEEFKYKSIKELSNEQFKNYTNEEFKQEINKRVQKHEIAVNKLLVHVIGKFYHYSNVYRNLIANYIDFLSTCQALMKNLLENLLSEKAVKEQLENEKSVKEQLKNEKAVKEQLEKFLKDLYKILSVKKLTSFICKKELINIMESYLNILTPIRLDELNNKIPGDIINDISNQYITEEMEAKKFGELLSKHKTVLSKYKDSIKKNWVECIDNNLKEEFKQEATSNILLQHIDKIFQDTYIPSSDKKYVKNDDEDKEAKEKIKVLSIEKEEPIKLLNTEEKHDKIIEKIDSKNTQTTNVNNKNYENFEQFLSKRKENRKLLGEYFEQFMAKEKTEKSKEILQNVNEPSKETKSKNTQITNLTAKPTKPFLSYSDYRAELFKKLLEEKFKKPWEEDKKTWEEDKKPREEDKKPREEGKKPREEKTEKSMEKKGHETPTELCEEKK